MKKFIVLIAMLLPLGAMATVPELNKIVDNYSATEGVTVVNLTGEMLKAQAGAAGADTSKYIEDIESLVILQLLSILIRKREVNSRAVFNSLKHCILKVAFLVDRSSCELYKSVKDDTHERHRVCRVVVTAGVKLSGVYTLILVK